MEKKKKLTDYISSLDKMLSEGPQKSY